MYTFLLTYNIHLNSNNCGVVYIKNTIEFFILKWTEDQRNSTGVPTLMRNPHSLTHSTQPSCIFHEISDDGDHFLWFTPDFHSDLIIRILF